MMALEMPIRCITSSSTVEAPKAQPRRILVNMPLFLPNMHDAVKAIIRGGAELQGMQFPNPFHTLDFCSQVDIEDTFFSFKHLFKSD